MGKRRESSSPNLEIQYRRMATGVRVKLERVVF